MKVLVRFAMRRDESRGTPRSTATRDSGLSLIEVLVSVVLMGIGVVVVLGALGASIRGSSVHQDKIAALAALESASAAITVQQDPCTVDAYETAAKSTLDPAWADRLVVHDLSGCGTDLHHVLLGVTAPGGLDQTLSVSVGGPRVADWDGGSAFDSGEEEVVSCAVTNLIATPDTMEVQAFANEGLLANNVTVTVHTDAVCSGTLRAYFTPPPVDPAGVEWAPPVDSDNEIVLPKESFTWSVGTVGLEIVQEIRDPETNDLISSTSIGSTSDLMELVPCGVSAVVDNPTPGRDDDGRLVDDLGTTVTVSDACPAVSEMNLTVDTGVSIHTDQLVLSGDNWLGTIAGQPDGPVFEPGPTAIEISVPTATEPIVIASIPIEVQP